MWCPARIKKEHPSSNAETLLLHPQPRPRVAHQHIITEKRHLLLLLVSAIEPPLLLMNGVVLERLVDVGSCFTAHREVIMIPTIRRRDEEMGMIIFPHRARWRTRHNSEITASIGSGK